MMENTQEKQDGKMADPTFKFRRFVLLLLCMLLWFSLLFYHAEDMDYFRGGITGAYPQNVLGALGSYLSWFMFITFGVAAYVVAAVGTVGALRRILCRRNLRRAGWEYKLSYPLLVLGFVIIFALFPEKFHNICASLNIDTMPGGIIGDLLCAEGRGFLYLLLNSVGSFILGSILILAGGWVIWNHDWNFLLDLLLNRLRRATPAENEKNGVDTEAEEIPVMDKKKGGDVPVFTPRKRAEKRPVRKDDQEPMLFVPENMDGMAQPVQENTVSSQNVKMPEKPVPAEPPATAMRQEPQPAPAVPRKQPNVPPQVISGVAMTADNSREEYVLPPLELLNRPVGEQSAEDSGEVERKKQIIQMTLDNFEIDAEVVNAIVGPQVTLFEIAPAANVRIDQIANLQNNFAMELQATTLRLLLPIPGQRLIGIEVPNLNPTKVFGYDLLQSSEWKKNKMQIPLLLGKSISGETVMLDLAKAPHLLIAGATGSGKSVCMNVLITSLLYKFRPDELRLIMVDPKVVEFQPYHSLPHLIVPVITEVDKVNLALRWTINEMERRYRVLAKVGVRNLEDFNRRPIPEEPQYDDNDNEIPAKMPFIVVIIDELADIMIQAQKDVEKSLAAIAAKSRAVGIHTIIATQRPDTKVLTGTIKSNYPIRIAFRVPSQIDSRTIMDTKGAETLLGRGDMLFKSMMNPQRIQGGMIEQSEMENVVRFVSQQAEQQFDDDVFKSPEEKAAENAEEYGSDEGYGDDGRMNADERLYHEAVRIVLRDKRPTISYIQRMLKIGYNKAATLIDQMEERGVIGPAPSHGVREILVASDPGLRDEDDDLDDLIDYEDA